MPTAQIQATKKPPCTNAWRLGCPLLFWPLNLVPLKPATIKLAEKYISFCSYSLANSTLSNSQYLGNLPLCPTLYKILDMNICHLTNPQRSHQSILAKLLSKLNSLANCTYY